MTEETAGGGPVGDSGQIKGLQRGGNGPVRRSSYSPWLEKSLALEMFGVFLICASRMEEVRDYLLAETENLQLLRLSKSICSLSVSFHLSLRVHVGKWSDHERLRDGEGTLTSYILISKHS